MPFTRRNNGWGTWTRTKNNGTRNRRVANYTIPHRTPPKPCRRSSLDDGRSLDKPGRLPSEMAHEGSQATDRLRLAEQFHRLEQRRRDAATGQDRKSKRQNSRP